MVTLFESPEKLQLEEKLSTTNTKLVKLATLFFNLKAEVFHIRTLK